MLGFDFGINATIHETWIEPYINYSVLKQAGEIIERCNISKYENYK